MAKSSDKTSLLTICSVGAVLIGFALFVGGLIVGIVDKPTNALTPEMVAEFNEAGSALERAASKEEQRNRKRKLDYDPATAPQTQAAKRRFTAAKEEMENATSGRLRNAYYLKIAGGLLTLVGVVGLLASRPYD